LIAGVDPSGSAELAAHAARITGRSMRRRLAGYLEHLERSRDEPRTPARVRPYQRAIQANALELRGLAILLRGSSPVPARGVALLRALISDGTGPAYTDREGRALACDLDNVRAAFGG
jgi:hypothetical protein